MTAHRQETSQNLSFGPNALAVLRDRYLLRDDNGVVSESPKQLFQRVAKSVAAVESKWKVEPAEIAEIEDEFFDLMSRGVFMPNSPTLMNAGRTLGMLSACFVLPLEDSIESIMETARQIALVQRAGGGTGVDFSALRPKGSIVRSSGGTTEGPLSFLGMLAKVTETIQQGAFRRGANMGMLRVDHPDIVDFVRLKQDLTQVTNYNLSVSMTDEFMDRLRTEPDSPHEVVHPVSSDVGYILKANDRPTYTTQNSEESDFWSVEDLWNCIVDCAWKTGEPGLIFIDEVNRHNPTPNVFRMVATNPCGEQPLGPYEACTLGSINLAEFVSDRGGRTPSERIDWAQLEKAVTTSIRFLDNVVEVNRYPTKEIEKVCLANRKIGLGVMGFADLLFRIGIQYNSEDALQLARKVGGFIQQKAHAADQKLAETRGAFPNWKGSVWDTRFGVKMRNAHCTTIAPTGTISIIAGCSGGIEPVFSLAFTRRVMEGQRLTEVNPHFRSRLEQYFEGDVKAVERMVEEAATVGSIAHTDLPDSMKAIFQTARDVESSWHVRMQAAWQEATDAAVSKTINLPESATRADVQQSYLLAHELKCKGITVYRDGSRQSQPMALTPKEGEEILDAESASASAGDNESQFVTPMKLPEIMPCIRVRQLTPFGNMHVTISVDPSTGMEREVFAQLGKGGDIANSDLEAICRLLSLFLRCNGSIMDAVGQLDDIGSSLSVPSPAGRIMSLADGLAEALKKYLNHKEVEGLSRLFSKEFDVGAVSPSPKTRTNPRPIQAAFKIKCPSCGDGPLVFEEGCAKCYSCGYAQC